MSDLLGRSFRLAKTYLDAAKERLEDVSASAQEELTRALNRDDIQSGLSASDDPMERAQAKINAARQTTAARESLSPERRHARPVADAGPADRPDADGL